MLLKPPWPARVPDCMCSLCLSGKRSCAGPHWHVLCAAQGRQRQRVFLEERLTEDAWSGQAMELLLSFDMYKGNTRCARGGGAQAYVCAEAT